MSEKPNPAPRVMGRPRVDHSPVVLDLCARPQGASREDVAEALGLIRHGLSPLMAQMTARHGLHRRHRPPNGGGSGQVKWFVSQEHADAWLGAPEPPVVEPEEPPQDEPIAGGQFAVAGPRVPLIGTGPEHRPPPVRDGAEAFRQYPSRFGSHLHYADGRIEKA